jgi:hypothetical protein
MEILFLAPFFFAILVASSGTETGKSLPMLLNTIYFNRPTQFLPLFNPLCARTFYPCFIPEAV